MYTAASEVPRELRYNVYLASLDHAEIHALCSAKTEGETSSLELVLHDSFISGTINEDTLGAEILVLLGEL